MATDRDDRDVLHRAVEHRLWRLLVVAWAGASAIDLFTHPPLSVYVLDLFLVVYAVRLLRAGVVLDGSDDLVIRRVWHRLRRVPLPSIAAVRCEGRGRLQRTLIILRDGSPLKVADRVDRHQLALAEKLRSLIGTSAEQGSKPTDRLQVTVASDPRIHFVSDDLRGEVVVQTASGRILQGFPADTPDSASATIRKLQEDLSEAHDLGTFLEHYGVPTQKIRAALREELRT